MNEQWQELKETITELRDNDGTGTQQEVCKFLVNYMDVLEKQIQEPCDDCISRQAVLEYIEGSWAELGHSSENELVCQDIKKMPPVTPQPKMGRWIKHENPNLGQCMKISYECSNCKVWLGCEYFVRKSYCPNCGAKMQEVEE